MKKIAAFVTTLILSTSSIAAEWTELFTEGDYKILLDVKSVRYISNNPYNYKQAWLKNIVVNDTTKDSLSVNDYLKVLIYVDCESMRIGQKTIHAYKNGKLFKTENNNVPLMKDAIPDSRGYETVEAVCSI